MTMCAAAGAGCELAAIRVQVQEAAGAREFDDDDMLAHECLAHELERVLRAILRISGRVEHCCPRAVEDEDVVVVARPTQRVGPRQGYWPRPGGHDVEGRAPEAVKPSLSSH